jgi:beta-lactamase regulating signal transducer with metallopeptidase domain
MMLPYMLRLVCLSLACFFLVHVSAGLITYLIAPAAIRVAERMRARRAAAFVLALRMAPLGLGALVVAGLCVPSYLKLEPDTAAEPVGFACLAAALLGIAIWTISIARAARATLASLRSVREFERSAAKTQVAGEQAPVWIVDGIAPLVALAGLVRARLVISRPVLQALSAEQMAAALRHERAHQKSHDNLKRLAILLAPNLVPFARSSGAIERAWARFAEWAADDRAVAGDPHVSLSLAAALVRVARMSAGAPSSCLVSTLLADGGDLSARVDRLLAAASGRTQPEAGSRVVVAGTVAALTACVAALMQPGLLSSVHLVLEQLVH